MTKFLTTKGIAHCVDEIITTAEKELVIISPYIQISTWFEARLRECERKGIHVSLVYGKSRLNNIEWEKIRDMNNIELRYHADLHAKCYFNEREMVIGSMNFYEYSESNNKEMGVLLHESHDKEAYTRGVLEARSIIEDAEIKIKSASKSVVIEATNGHDKEHGYCIRCKTEIRYNALAPFCKSCFSSWANWADPYYKEKYCHGCGKGIAQASKNTPQCSSCFKLNPVYPS